MIKKTSHEVLRDEIKILHQENNYHKPLNLNQSKSTDYQ